MNLTQDDIDAIALSVKDSLSPELQKVQTQIVLVKEIHRLMGLDTRYPLNVTQSSRYAGNIFQNITLNPSTQTTIVERIYIRGIGVDVIGVAPIAN